MKHTDSEAGAASPVISLPRPSPVFPALSVGAYVVDRITGLKSQAVELRAEPAPFRASHRVGQVDGPNVSVPMLGKTAPTWSMGLVWIDVYDPGRALASGAIEAAIKYPDGDFGAWIPSAAVPASGGGSAGSFGVDADITRFMSFALAPKPHNTILKYRVRLARPDGSLATVHEMTETYDSDRDPEFDGAPRLWTGAWIAAQAAWEVRLAWKLDNDGQAIRWGSQSTPYPADRAQIPDGAFTNLIAKRYADGDVIGYLAPGATRYYAVAGYSAANGSGRRTLEPYVQVLTGAPDPTATGEIPDASITADKLVAGIRNFLNDPLAFSATDHDTVAWASHTLRLSNGDSYPIAAGNTGSMGGPTYIYWDVDTPNEYRTTTSLASATSDERLFICYARAGSAPDKAAFYPAVGRAGIARDDLYQGIVTANEIKGNAITADKIAANAVTADKIAANSITAVKLAALAVTSEKIASGAITADKIAAGAISTNTLETNQGYIRIDGTGMYIRGFQSQYPDDAGKVHFTTNGTTVRGQMYLAIGEGVRLEADDALTLEGGSGIFLVADAVKVRPFQGGTARTVLHQGNGLEYVSHDASGVTVRLPDGTTKKLATV